MPAHRRFSICDNTKSGYTLVELSIVIIIISLLTASGLAVGASMVARAGYVDTGKLLDQLEQSLRDYYVVNGRLPCPAAIDTLPGAAGFGEETACTAGGAIAGTHHMNDGGGVRSGMIPVRTLGLPDNAASDKYGSRILYVVNEDLTDTVTFGGATEAITILDADDDPILTNAAYAVLSQGPDRRAAFSYSTGQVLGDCASGPDTLDEMNCMGAAATTAEFRDAPFNNGDEEDFYFDDLIRWSPKFHFMALDTSSFILWEAIGDNIYSVGTDSDTLNTNVGIGISSPTAKLDVSGTDALRLRAGDNSSASLENNQLLLSYNGSGNYTHAIKSRHNSGADAGNSIDFYVWDYGTDAASAEGTHRVMSLDGGNVYIEEQVRVAQDSTYTTLDLGLSAPERVYIRGGTGSAGRLDLMGATEHANGATIDLNGRTNGADGRIGMIAATTSSSSTVYTHYLGKNSAGSISPLVVVYADGHMIVQGPTWCTIGSGAGNTACSSDKRYKKNIEPIENALDKLLEISGVYYKWNGASPFADKERVHLGVIAQEVQKVFPQAVTEDEHGYLMVSTATLVPVLIEGMRELKNENDALQAAQAEWREQSAAFERRVAALEAPDRDAGLSPAASQHPWVLMLLLAAAVAGGVAALVLCQLRSRRCG